MSGQTHTNQLVHETSPYLLQHAHNPVRWYPWGEEAFAMARKEDKPIFLSVGYSACHWCHVMAHESFEDVETAEVMNAHFVNVKVDREERPDVDEIYMNAVQVMTGSGGWPMSVFLTPDGRPFYGGTYFPPESRYGMPSFRQVLLSVARHYQEKRDNVDQVSARLHERLIDMGRIQAGEGELTAEDFTQAYRKIASNLDRENGGFGQQPKFPNTMNLEVLLRAYVRTGDTDARDAVQLTLEKMAHGGIYDQLGGGFHRYSVDAHWLVPHFEKMLYDNALLIPLYLRAFQVTGKPLFRQVVEESLAYVMREMTAPEGGFFSTQDADSEGEEGRFFVWTPDEVMSVLGPEMGEPFCALFDVSESGNFEGENILNMPRSKEAVAHDLGMELDVFEGRIAEGRKRLFETREGRVKPGRDDKVQANWNGLMISAFAQVYQVLERPDYLAVAIRAAQFVLNHMRQPDGRLLHVYKDGQAKFNGYQDDYACLIGALIDLYEATFDRRWLSEAAALTEVMCDQFWDDSSGSFMFTGRDHEALIVRSTNPYDNATPSGNSVGALNLMRLSLLLERADYRDRASRILRAFLPYLRQIPSGFGNMVCALEGYLQTPIQVAVIGDLQRDDTQHLLRAIHRKWRPSLVLCGVSPERVEGDAATVPLLKGRGSLNGMAAAYVCRNFACSLPVTEAAALEKLLAETEITE